MKLRWQLFMLAAGALAPVLALTLAAAFLIVSHERETMQREALGRARSAMSAIDAELRGHFTTLAALAASKRLESGDIRGFHEEAKRVLANHPNWLNVDLASSTKKQLMDAAMAFGGEKPLTGDLASYELAVRGDRDVVGNVDSGAVIREPAVGIRVPVAYGGTVRYVLTVPLKPESFAPVLRAQRLPEDWVIALVDRNRNFIARIPAMPAGQPASESFRAHMGRAPEGWFRGRTVEGFRTYTPYVTSDLSGWVLGIAIPASTVEAAAWRSAGIMAVALIAALSVAFWIAWLVSKRIARPVVALAAATDAMGRGEEVEFRDPGSIEEILKLRDALQRAHGAIREREERFRVMADAAPVLVWMSGTDKLCTWFNKAWLDFVGRRMERELGNGWAENVHPDDFERCLQIYSSAFDARQPFSMEYRLRRRDGQYRWLRDDGTPRFEAKGRFAGYIGACMDISSSKQAEQALRASEERLAGEATALSRLHDSSSRLWRAQSLREGLEEMLDATIDVLGADMGNVQLLEGGVLKIAAQRGFKQDFLDFFREVSTEDDFACGRAGATGERMVIEDVETDPAYAPLRQIARAAGYRAVQSTPLIGRGGKPLGMISTHWRSPHLPHEQHLRRLDLHVRQALDFIERAAAEERLRVSEQALAQRAHLLDLTHDAIIVRDRDSRILFWNSGAEQMYGWKADEVLGKVTHSLLAPQFPVPLEEIMEEVHRSGRWSGVLVHTRRDGTRMVVGSRWALERDKEGRPDVLLELNSDITERKRAEDAVREAEERTRSIVDHVVDGIITIDESGAVQTFNPAAERIFGYAASEVIGQNVKRLMPDPYRREHDGYIANYERTGQPKIIGIGREVEGLRKDGSTFPLDLAVSVFHLGPRRYFTGVVRDITERKHAEVALKEADRAKDEFLAMLSHELRNPLAALTSSAHVLKVVPPSSADAIKARGVVERQTKHMTSLISDLLDISRVTHGKLSLQRERFNAAEALFAVINVWRATGRLGAHMVSPSLEPVWVEGDRVRIEQITSNLLDNAIKFTPAGKSITVNLRRDDGEAVLRVADEGIGLAPEDCSRIFDLFVQGNFSPRAGGGLGIGLALVKRLAELHGGSASAASEGRGRGVTFTVRLPAVDQPPVQAKKPSLDVASARSILIVEDNDDARQMLQAILSLDGHQVCAARDGKSGLALAAEACPDLALIDIALPDMDGYEVARRLRTSNGNRRIHLIAISGFGQAQDQRRAYEAGFDAYLVKPVVPERLKQAIAGLR